MIPLNKVYHAKNELRYVSESLTSDSHSGDGRFSKACNEILKKIFPGSFPLLTTSCTHSLEMSSLMFKIKPGDEVIIPSYTFVSTANAFLMRGATLIFCDSHQCNPNMDVQHAKSLITNKTRIIVPVHYAGIACQMDELISISNEFNIKIVEDNAHGFGAYYKNKLLGTIGDLGCFSFHDTKNISCGEGGAILINDTSLVSSGEIIREKGTDRSSFLRGEINKYGWKELGSSYLLSDILAAKLMAQFEELDAITTKRKELWNYYYNSLLPLSDKELIDLPEVPNYANHSGHIFYIVCKSINVRDLLIEHLRENGIQSAFHYQSLHKSEYFSKKYNGIELLNADRYSNCLIRLPLYPDLSHNQIRIIIDEIFAFYK